MGGHSKRYSSQIARHKVAGKGGAQDAWIRHPYAVQEESMRKSRGIFVVLLLTAGFVLGMGVSAAEEKHPEIHKAQKFLADAKNALQHAAHDYEGHRVKAIDHIDEAQAELKLALESDKK
jgi:hypothetical protein